MSRKRLLYTIFGFYVLVIFLPVNLMMYFPDLFPFKIPFFSNIVNTTPSKSSEVSESTLSEISAFEKLSTEEVEKNFQDFKDKFRTFGKGNLESIKGTTITVVTGDGLKMNLLFTDNSKFFCNAPTFKFKDTEYTSFDTSYVSSTSVEDNPYTEILRNAKPVELLNVSKFLSSHALLPIHYELLQSEDFPDINNQINWIRIFSKDCSSL